MTDIAGRPADNTGQQRTGEWTDSLPEFAALAAYHLEQNFPAETLPFQQVLGLAEEAGEFVSAYRRFRGLARRAGSWAEVEAELADVAITAYVTASILGIDLDKAWRAKAQKILTRGWREENAEDSWEPLGREAARSVSVTAGGPSDAAEVSR